MEREIIQDNQENVSVPPYSFLNGYFGKPTKMRTSEPSMFEILTWNDDQHKKRQCPKGQKCACKCQCWRSNKEQSLAKERKSSPNQNSNSNKKIKDQQKNNTKEGREKQSSKALKENNHGKTKDGKIQNHFSQNRPKSAGNKIKSVKILSSPQKLPKFIDQAFQRQQYQKNQASQEAKEKMIEKFKQTTRWIPNSSFTTYFAKPAFENYGRGNTNPTFGGLMYGDYLKTHNIQPHRGINSPKSIQSYTVALMKGSQIGPIYPYPPKVSRQSNLISGETKDGGNFQYTEIYPSDNTIKSFPICSPNLFDLERFGGKGIPKIIKHRLQRSHYNKQNQGSNDQYEGDSIRQSVNGSRKYVY